MRTTLDLPDSLARRAKVAAVHKGLTLRRLVVDALEHELEVGGSRNRATRTRLPVIRSHHPGSCDLDAEKIADILLREEIAAYEIAQRR